MSFPLGNSREITAHKINLIQGSQVVDIVDLVEQSGGGSDIAAHDARISALESADTAQDTTLAQHGGSISSLHNSYTAHSTRISALESADTAQDTAIAAKQDQLSVSAPITLTNGALGLDLSSTHVQCSQLTAQYDVNCGDLTASALYGGAALAVQVAIDTAVATREPAFQTTADLAKGFNFGTSPPTIELGISSALESRIASVEAGTISSLSASAPITLANDTIGLDLSSTHVQCSQLTTQFDVNCGDLTAAALYGGAVAQIQAAINSAIAALPKVASGMHYIANTVNGSTYATAVSFPAGAFTAAPNVVVNQSGGNVSGHASIRRIWAINVSTTQFTLVVEDTQASGGVDVSWIAVQ